MHEWRDYGIILSVRKQGENGYIANVLTCDNGRHLGWISSSQSKRNILHIQPGNVVNLYWKARLIEQLGYYKFELISSIVGKIIDNKLKLLALTSLCSVLETILPERQKYTDIYEASTAFLNLLLLDQTLTNVQWLKGYVKWEIGVLASTGFALNLKECAVTKSKSNLFFVSPKTGKAVSKLGAGKYASKLLQLPMFLGGANIINNSFYDEIKTGLKITTYFFKNKLLDNNKYNQLITPARNRFIEAIEKC